MITNIINIIYINSYIYIFLHKIIKISCVKFNITDPRDNKEYIEVFKPNTLFRRIVSCLHSKYRRVQLTKYFYFVGKEEGG